MKYKITFLNQITQLWGVTIGVPFAVYLIYLFSDGFTDFSSATTAGFIYFSTVFFITIFIHCEFYFLNKGKIVIINEDQKTISFDANTTMHFEELEKITLFMTQLKFYKSNYWIFPSDPYHYAIIKYKNGTAFIFTSLMTSEVEVAMNKITGVQIDRKLQPIPSPMLSKLLRSLWSRLFD
jgi:hypothetical protein